MAGIETEGHPFRTRTVTPPLEATELLKRDGIRYSICTLVNSPDQYRAMEHSFQAAGFTGHDVEFLYLDNVGGNRFDAYAGVNLFLALARGEFIILCHQDVVLAFDDRLVLDRRIAEVTERDPTWAVLGNAGGFSPGQLALHISDPHGEDRRMGQLPCRVTALDEDFILVRRKANLGLPRAVEGFHFYGAALCVSADMLGHSSWAIDFHLRHLSGGVAGPSFLLCKRALIGHFRRAWRPRWVTTPSGSLYLSGSSWASHLLNLRPVVGIRRRLKLGRNPARSIDVHRHALS